MPRDVLSIKIPKYILDQLPSGANRRAHFILQAIEEKLARHRSTWQPQTERGRRMAALLAKGNKERLPLLSDEKIEQELNERRGRGLQQTKEN